MIHIKDTITIILLIKLERLNLIVHNLILSVFRIKTTLKSIVYSLTINWLKIVL